MIPFGRGTAVTWKQLEALGRRFINDGMAWKPKEKDRLAKLILEDAKAGGQAIASKDTLLFRYEDTGKVFREGLLGVFMLPLWTYLSYFCYHLDQTIAPVKRNLSQELKEGWVIRNIERARVGVAVGFFLFGACMSSYWFARTNNTVRRLILRKGGKHVTIITHGLLGGKQLTVPVSHCSGVRTTLRSDNRYFMNVKNHRFRYQLNVEGGIFSNRPLFDRTVGASRRF